MRVVNPRNAHTFPAKQVAVILGPRQVVPLSQLLRREQLIEDVEVALLRLLHDNARLLKQVGLNEGAADGVVVIEVNLDPLAEARGVVVSYRLRVAEGFQNGVGLCQKRREIVPAGCAARERNPTQQSSSHILAPLPPLR